MSKGEKKKLCGLMDVKRLTIEASMHAAQNDRLPLRVVVQVLYFEQLRAAATSAQRSSSISCSRTTTTTDDGAPAKENGKSLRSQMDKTKRMSEELRLGAGKKSGRSGGQLLPSRSRRIFDKIWAVGKGAHGGNRSSETSGSSQSPTSMAPGDTKSSGSSSRHRRHSIS